MANHASSFDWQNLTPIVDLDDPFDSPPLTSPTFPPSFSLSASSPSTTSASQQSSSSNQVSALATDTSFSEQSLFTHYTLDSLGLCPPADQSLSTTPQSYSSQPRAFDIRSRRKSKDLEHYLDFSHPTVTALPSQSTLPASRPKFLARVENIFRPKKRQDKASPVGSNKLASLSTSALSAFDFGFDSSRTQEEDTRSLCSDTELDDDMGLMRSLTNRMKRVEGEEPSIMRSLTRKRPETPLEHIQAIKIKGRPTISLPTQLLSTTNMSSYNAPSVQDMRAIARQQAADVPSSPLSETTTADRPVSSSGSQRSVSNMSEPSLTDASSILSRSSSQDEPVSPTDTSRRGDYFDLETPATSCESTPCSSPERKRVEFDASAPAIPQRAASHSKREHVRLARHRSVRSSLRAASMKLEGMNAGGIVDPTMGLMAPASVILSQSSTQPFSSELEQLSEAVEEFASSAAARDEEIELAAASVHEDVVYMADKGLANCSIDEYLADIQPLTTALFA